MGFLRIASVLFGVATICSAPVAEEMPTAAFANEPSVEIHGLVQDRERTPLAGATVRLLRSGLSARLRTREWVEPQTTRTAPDGTFFIAAEATASYTVRIEAAEHAPFTATEIPGGASLRIHLDEGQTATGRVVDEATGDPVAGATVLACDDDALIFGEQACRSTATDMDGRFSISHLAEGPCELQARSAARAVSDIPPIELPQASDGGIEIRLGPGAGLSGRVVDDEDLPLDDVLITFQPKRADGRRARAGRTWPIYSSEDGTFAHPGLAAGARYTVRANKPGFPEVALGPYAVEEGQDVENVTIRLKPAATLLLRLLDTDGNPIDERLSVLQRNSTRRPEGTLARSGTRVPDASVFGEGDGRYRVVGLVAGRYHFDFRLERWADLEREDVALRAGSTTDLGSLVVRQGKTIRGRVSDPDDSPIVKARIQSMDRAGSAWRQHHAVTDEEGRYELRGLGEAPLPLVQARADGFGEASLLGVLPGDDAVDFVLEPTGSISGHVLLEDGRPPPAFNLRAHREAGEAGSASPLSTFQGSAPPSQSFANEDGSFRLLDVATGTYTVEARAAGKAPARRSGVSVGAGESVAIGTITLVDGIEVRGRVLDLRDGAPVRGARVEAHLQGGWASGLGGAQQEAVTTDETGGFVITGLGPGAHRVRATHAEFAAGESSLDLRPGGTVEELRIVLSQGGTLAGTVRDAEGGPVADARIGLAAATLSGSEFRSATTGPDGRYEFQRIGPGNYNAMLVPDARSVTPNLTMKPAEIREGEVTIVDFDEIPRISLSGTVRRGSQTLPETSLFFLSSDGSLTVASFKSSRSDASGRYQVGLDRPGRYRVIVQTSGHLDFSRSAHAEIDVPDEPQVERDIAIRGGAVTGNVTGDGGSPVHGATITARADGAPSNGRVALDRAVTDGNGLYRIDGLDPGTYRVTANAVGFRLASAHPVTIADGEAARVDLELEPATSLHGRVVDPRGQAVRGALVLVAASGSTELTIAASGQTDINGMFRLSAPVEGPLDVTAIANGWAPARLIGVLAPESPDDPGLSLRVSAGARLRVLVRGAGGQPAASIQLELRPLPAYLGGEMAMLTNPPPPTDTAGTTVVERLAAGSYEVAISGAADLPSRTVTLTEGAEAAIEILLEADGASPPD